MILSILQVGSAMGLGIRPFERGLQELGNGGYAWLQPDGGWGWSNAGLIVDGEKSLLVDTLFDKPLTRDMLSAMCAAEPEATKQFDVLVNTHSNGDHCNGNELVHGAEIIASKACAEELARDRHAVDVMVFRSVARKGLAVGAKALIAVLASPGPGAHPQQE